MNYIPPLNFGFVEDDLYRSGQPNELNFPFLEKLHLKKIIWLSAEDPSEQLEQFVEEQEIGFINLGQDNEQLNSWSPISEEVVISALKLILDPKNYPLMVMDGLGRHRSGLVIGCLRKLQRWNLTSIFEEYRRYAGTKVRLMNEQFIELFDTDLVSVPENHCEWL
eukprot:TRINITY_DN28236_c0_g1_i1.p1 TRINITY_DN28236_c0_g1~~TRINITY_DN28236_c0_g1_i1.p1  ORF type:complete len:190 (-),score=22.14 TRINITY_DN28236_c0_g1_i1:166-660(-)